MTGYREQLPQLDADAFLMDGGLETTLIFDDGLELPDFAAFTLIDDARGREALIRYYEHYVAVAERDRVGIVLDTATWRASPDWAPRRGYSIEQLEQVNRAAVTLVDDVRRRGISSAPPVVISGAIGPRGDGYQAGALMHRNEARAYHALQARVFADAGADMISAITMTHSSEAIGVADAAGAVGMPVVISFTVETNGVLPSGEPLGDAIIAVDEATDGAAAYFMVNCAHPTHFSSVLDPEQAWTKRVRGIRANASRMSHAELDEAEELDRGDPDELADLYAGLLDAHPQLTALGGCCGTDHTHISAISTRCIVGRRAEPGGA
jgi:S-methylmethionine-dependent homocysteine/selenocysteine methylase